MIQYFPNEVFKEFKVPEKLLLRYAISNYGRMISFKDHINKGRILNGSIVNGYRVFSYKLRNEQNEIKNVHMYYFRLVADYFVPKTNDNQTFVIHLDHDVDNNFYKNLKWVTREEMYAFMQLSPKVIEAKKRLIEERYRKNIYKLTPTRVMLLKQKLLDPNRKTRYKILAKQFGVSEMQLYRIKSGENWGHIKVNIPPKKEE